MSIFLCGGGDVDLAEFVAEAAVRSQQTTREVPRIAVVAIDTGHGSFFTDEIAESLTDAGACEPVIRAYRSDQEAILADLVDTDGIYVAGGPTPDYLRALQPVVGEIRRRVAAGTPYFGVSAGALLAAEKALIGGYRIGDVPVAPEMIGEGIDELEVASGIGLVDITVEVHAAQWGTLGRLVAATEAGVVEGGVAIDEDTALVVSDGGLRVVGSGSVWQVFSSEHGVVVTTAAAG
ncbi:cyanophycinase [Paramicrobacterium humi]|uniref:Cyanophycinase n=1 Tax=Paramicrobacterium humi TaxID=640635 RepID=A0A1H4P843_9MICO|nr:Type 1 glutamine amidotransferase-like domain-containing protein [Microbacterium humi]SEC03404.1 cyanophycinase [Microbacterium humi]